MSTFTACTHRCNSIARSRAGLTRPRATLGQRKQLVRDASRPISRCSGTVHAGSNMEGGKLVIPTSYLLPAKFAALAAATWLVDIKPIALFCGFVAAVTTVSASRSKFVFGDDALEVVVNDDKDSENAFVGGENKWKYSSFTNWEFWFPGFPILAYFKETQTKPEGQIHFFPIVCDGKMLYDTMVERCGPSQNSAPK